jgi:hypothetical protein
MRSEEYEAWCREQDSEADAANQADSHPTSRKQVLAALVGYDDDISGSLGHTPSDAGIPNPDVPGALPRAYDHCADPPVNRRIDFAEAEETTTEAIMWLAGENGENMVHKEIITNPLTPDHVADL